MKQRQSRLTLSQSLFIQTKLVEIWIRTRKLDVLLVNELVIGAEDKWIEVVMKVVEVNELELVLLGILVVLVEDSDVLELDEVNDMSSTEDIENIGIAWST